MNTVSRESSIDASVFFLRRFGGVVPLSARIYLGRARSTLTRGGSVSCFVLHQQASRLEKELEMHHGFYRTPLVPGCLKVLQQVFPSAAGAVQRHLSKESHSFGCASQNDWRAHADTQLRIDWKVRHGHLTSHCGPKFHTPYRTLSFDQLAVVAAASFVWSGHIRPRGCQVKACCMLKFVE